MTRCSEFGVNGVLLAPITATADPGATWAGAIWVGEIEEARLSAARRLALEESDGFGRARILVWNNGLPRGFAEVEVTGGEVNTGDLRAAIADMPPVEVRNADWAHPAMSVVVCTRDRPEHLRVALENLARLDYPRFEILVIDNNPTSGLTPPIVAEIRSISDIEVRHVDAPGQGLSIARNVAVRNAKYDHLAFTDDDVIVDDRWLSNLAYGFARGPKVACVCGMVPSAELCTPAQSYFDRRVGWARGTEPAIFDLETPPADDPLFPMRVAQFGTGANFAARRGVLIELGGFDEGLGMGSPTGGGEDIDMFVRFLLAGHSLVREPAAVVWHRHRRNVVDLDVQVRNYGVGLGAWITKLGCHPRTFGMAVRRMVPAVKHLRQVTVVERDGNESSDREMDALYGRELQGVLSGPRALITARLAGRRATPLNSGTSRLARTFDFHRGGSWGDPNSVVMAGRLSLIAAVLGLIGALGAVSALPTAVLAIAVGFFVLGGPGTLVLSWYTHLPISALIPLIPAVSIAGCLISVSGLLMLGFYNPPVVLLGITMLTAAGGLARCAYLARAETVAAS